MMRRIRFAGLVLLLLLPALTNDAAMAQSREREHPTPMHANELRGELDSSGDEYFYSFVAGPGEIRITVDVKSSNSTAVLEFELLDREAANQILCCEYAQASFTGESGRNIKSVKLGKRQIIVLHLTQGTTGRGTYRVRVTGAAQLKGTEEDILK